MPDDPASWLPRLARRFIAFEGADGCGKSTQLKRLVALCHQHALPLCEVREPGGTEVGERIRAILLDKAHSDMSLRCEMLLYMASRAHLVDRCIRPALAAGKLVIADRFVSSTIAYQGAAGGLPRGDIDAVAAVAIQGVQPELVLIYDVDEQTAAKRAGIIAAGKGKRAEPGAVSLFADRMEDRDLAFRRAVRQSYLDQAREDPARHAVIDASRGPEEVWEQTLTALRAFAA